MNKYRIFLVIIVGIAIYLRFFQLAMVPPSLNWDEAAWGYNAYSIGIDGKDEFGRFLPYDYLESFGDFKPPLYAYVAIIPIKLFGLNEFAVRFPSAFFGVLTVFLTYFLVKQLFKDYSYKRQLGLLSAFILAISPWHILLSRAAFEANVATFFIVSGVLFFLYAINTNKYFLMASIISFVLSIYTFNTARIVSPLLAGVLFVAFFKKIIPYKKELFLAVFLGVLITFPTLKFLFSPQASLRFKEVNIFSDISVIEQTNQEILNDNNSVLGKIIHNRRIAYGIEFLKHYTDNLNPLFLFIYGDKNPRFSVQSVGQEYIWAIPFFVIGAFLLFRKRYEYWWLIPLWILLGIIPAGTARETPHALRIETTLPMFQVLIAFGLLETIHMVTKSNINSMYKKGLACLLVFLIVGNLVYFYHDYFVHYPIKYASEWQYGYKGVVSYLEEEYPKYETIYISDVMGRPYTYVLFHSKYNPQKFRKEAVVKREALGFVHVNGFDKYRFVKDYTLFSGKNKILFIDSPGNVPRNAVIKKDFYLLNGDKVLVAYTF